MDLIGRVRPGPGQVPPQRRHGLLEYLRLIPHCPHLLAAPPGRLATGRPDVTLLFTIGSDTDGELLLTWLAMGYHDIYQ